MNGIIQTPTDADEDIHNEHDSLRRLHNELGVTAALHATVHVEESDVRLCPCGAHAKFEDHSNAVRSRLYPELRWIGRSASGADGQATWLLKLLTWVFFPGFGLLVATTRPLRMAETVGWQTPNTLMWLQCCLAGVAYASLSFVVNDLRKTIRPDASTSTVVPESPASNVLKYALDTKVVSNDTLQSRSALALVGVGHTRISMAETRVLKRWRILLCLISVAMSGVAVKFMLDPFLNPDAYDALLDKVDRFMRGTCWLIFPWVCLCGWGLSMLVATTLVHDSIIEVTQAALRSQSFASQKDRELWLDAVENPALALRRFMEILSYGWSQSLIGVVIFCFANSLSAFARGVNVPYNEVMDTTKGVSPGTSRNGDFVVSGVYLILLTLTPIQLAKTSSYCNKLMNALNEVRMHRRGEGHRQIEWLEAGLKQLNNGKGLGFVVYGTVLDTRVLSIGAAKLGSLFVSVVTVVLGLQQLRETRQVQACGLDQSVKLFVEDCVNDCVAKAGVSVNATLIMENCTVIPAPCVDCMAPLLDADVSLTF